VVLSSSSSPSSIWVLVVAVLDCEGIDMGVNIAGVAVVESCQDVAVAGEARVVGAGEGRRVLRLDQGEHSRAGDRGLN
jgi:hypothetical protein